jgi:hypothetical protein
MSIRISPTYSCRAAADYQELFKLLQLVGMLLHHDISSDRIRRTLHGLRRSWARFAKISAEGIGRRWKRSQLGSFVRTTSPLGRAKSGGSQVAGTPSIAALRPSYAAVSGAVSAKYTTVAAGRSNRIRRFEEGGPAARRFFPRQSRPKRCPVALLHHRAPIHSQLTGVDHGQQPLYAGLRAGTAVHFSRFHPDIHSQAQSAPGHRDREQTGHMRSRWARSPSSDACTWWAPG